MTLTGPDTRLLQLVDDAILVFELLFSRLEIGHLLDLLLQLRDLLLFIGFFRLASHISSSSEAEYHQHALKVMASNPTPSRTCARTSYCGFAGRPFGPVDNRLIRIIGRLPI